MKEKKPKIKKPKSVDEIRLLECIHPDGELYLVDLVISTKKTKENIKRFLVRDKECGFVPGKYRIRKWRAETVCEWREDLDEDGRVGWYFTKCKRYRRIQDDKYCGCGGKIKVLR